MVNEGITERETERKSEGGRDRDKKRVIRGMAQQGNVKHRCGDLEKREKQRWREGCMRGQVVS